MGAAFLVGAVSGCSSGSPGASAPSGSDGGRDGGSDGGTGGEGDGGCVKESGTSSFGDAAADGGCSGLSMSDCITCCQESYPKGVAAYARAYTTCACGFCGGSCPVTCGCGTVEDDSCTNCINGYRSNDAGCFSTLDSTCKGDPDCNAYLGCANGVCQAGL